MNTSNKVEETFSKARATVDLIREMVINTINELDSTTRPDEDSLTTVRRWEALQALVSAGKAAVDPEMIVRKQVMAAVFPEAQEGVNTVELGSGWKLKGTRKIDRKLDEATLPDTIAQLRAAMVNTDELVEYKPALKLAKFRELTEEQKLILANSLTEKDASPSLELVAPKVRK